MSALPWFMKWKPVDPFIMRATYRWWATPFAPLYVMWTTTRLRLESRRLDRLESRK